MQQILHDMLFLLHSFFVSVSKLLKNYEPDNDMGRKYPKLKVLAEIVLIGIILGLFVMILSFMS